SAAGRRAPRSKSEVVVATVATTWLHDHAQPLRCAGDTGVKPSRAAVLERETLVEQHHVVPLRALRFVNREHVTIVEPVIGLALLPRDRLDRAPEAVAADR